MSKLCWLFFILLTLFGCVSANPTPPKDDVLSHSEVIWFLSHSSGIGSVNTVKNNNLGPDACESYLLEIHDVAKIADVPFYIGIQNPAFIIALSIKPLSGSSFFADGYVFTGDRDKAVIKLFGGQKYDTCFESTPDHTAIDRNKPLRVYRVSGKVNANEK
jgi:hypothetical protein